MNIHRAGAELLRAVRQTVVTLVTAFCNLLLRRSPRKVLTVFVPAKCPELIEPSCEICIGDPRCSCD